MTGFGSDHVLRLLVTVVAMGAQEPVGTSTLDGPLVPSRRSTSPDPRVRPRRRPLPSHPNFGGIMQTGRVRAPPKRRAASGIPRCGSIFAALAVRRLVRRWDRRGGRRARSPRLVAREHPGLALSTAASRSATRWETPRRGRGTAAGPRLVCLARRSELFVARLAHVVVPKLFVQGEHDEYGPLQELRDGLARVAHPRRCSYPGRRPTSSRASRRDGERDRDYLSASGDELASAEAHVHVIGQTSNQYASSSIPPTVVDGQHPPVGDRLPGARELGPLRTSEHRVDPDPAYRPSRGET